MISIPRHFSLLLLLSPLMLLSSSVPVSAQAPQPPRAINNDPVSKTCTVAAPATSREGEEAWTRKQQKEQWLQLANAAYTDTPQRLSEAEGFYKNVIQADGKESRALVGLANVFVSTKRYDEAVEKYQDAIKINPKSVAAHYGLGNAFAALDQHEMAVTQYKKAIELNPRLAEAHYNLANVYYKQNNTEGVLREVEILMTLDEELAQRLKSLVNKETKS